MLNLNKNLFVGFRPTGDLLFLCSCKAKVSKKKARPDFTAFLRLFGIFFTLNFELASLRHAKFS